MSGIAATEFLWRAAVAQSRASIGPCCHTLSDVHVETQRITAGINWKPYHDMNVYLRYVYYDFNDIWLGS